MAPLSLQDMIATAIAMGRFRRIEEGVRALACRQPEPKPLPIRPEACGCGRQVSRMPGLDFYDRVRGAA